jgi:hypothetical protein
MGFWIRECQIPMLTPPEFPSSVLRNPSPHRRNCAHLFFLPSSALHPVCPSAFLFLLLISLEASSTHSSRSRQLSILLIGLIATLISEAAARRVALVRCHNHFSFFTRAHSPTGAKCLSLQRNTLHIESAPLAPTPFFVRSRCESDLFSLTQPKRRHHHHRHPSLGFISISLLSRDQQTLCTYFRARHKRHVGRHCQQFVNIRCLPVCPFGRATAGSGRIEFEGPLNTPKSWMRLAWNFPQRRNRK